MRNEPITHRRMWAWLLAAMFAPLAHFSGSSWLAVLVAGVIVCGALALIPGYALPESKLLGLIQYAWILYLLSRLAPLSAQYWPGRGSSLVIPTVLLLLAAYANTRRPSRVAGVLFWVLLLMLVPLFIAGVKDVVPQRLAVRNMELAPLLLPVLLLPFAARLLPAQQEEGYGWYPWIILLAVGLSMLTWGVLTPMIASTHMTPFRELSRCLTVGSTSRFESLVSVMITLGWYSLYSLLLRIAHVLSRDIPVLGNSYLTAFAAIALSVAGDIPTTGYLAVQIVLWILMPYTLGKIKSKKLKKGIDK